MGVGTTLLKDIIIYNWSYLVKISKKFDFIFLQHATFRKSAVFSIKQNNKKMKTILIIGTAIVTFASCGKMVDRTSGALITESRTATYFNEVHAQDHIDIHYTQDTMTSIAVEAGENLIDYIQTDIVNGKLVIFESSNTIANHKIIKVTITSDSLNSVEMEGSGDFNGNNMSSTFLNVSTIGSGNFKADAWTSHIDVSSTGSGDVQLTGGSDSQNFELKGSGDLNARFMIADSVSVNVIGSGDATVHADNYLNATLSGSGDINFYGNPGSVVTSDTGSGDIILKN
jgi:hypothetical protein